MPGSQADYDGDGDITEGIYYEIEGVREYLYAAIQAYAADVAGTAITYDANRYPYFFGDANANGAVDEGEEGFAAWTPRLLQGGVQLPGLASRTREGTPTAASTSSS